MGIYSEIYLCKPPDGAFHPGGAVAGVIKYSIDEPTEFTKITVSLKGDGLLRVSDALIRRVEGGKRLFRASEICVDDDVTHGGNGTVTPIGSYEINFNFNLPRNIPNSLKLSKFISKYSVRCDIRYYVRIKFEIAGLFSLAKHFKKDITVTSGITPSLPKQPVIHGHQKKLTQFFSFKTSIVHIKANMLTPVIAPGDKIKLEYEVFNDTNVEIKSVETKLVEDYTFLREGYTDIKAYEDVPNTEAKTGAIACGATQAMPLEINPPPVLFSLQNSKILKRDYAVCITVRLPIPHRNAVLMIPVQIGHEERQVQVANNDNPPSYWEAMGEGTKDGGFDDED